MTQTIPAVYEHGTLKLLTKVNLSNHQQVVIVLFPSEDDVPTLLIDQAAGEGRSFDFLAQPAEDIYRPTDGEPI